MLREPLAERGIGEEAGFRWRGTEVSRLEGFTDAVFGVSLTLLIVSLEVPDTFDDLLRALRGVPAFALSLVLLMQIWYSHYRYFRRYGLQDTVVVALNALLIFIVLIYIYPLKFLFTLVTGQIFGGFSDTTTLASGETATVITQAQLPTLFVIYGLGFAGIFFIFTLLYLYAYRKRVALALTALEQFDTRSAALENGLLMALGLASVGLALTGGEGLAGWIYLAIPILLSITGTYFGIRRRRYEGDSGMGEAPNA